MMSKKVLIVEDNELNMKLFHDLLDAQGYETLQTREGLQALALARQHRPDLILMDIQLPEISGLEVTKWLKEDDDLSHIPVVAVTATTGMGASSSSSFSHLVTSRPEISGSWMSMRIRSGWSAAALARAVAPSEAVRTS